MRDENLGYLFVCLFVLFIHRPVPLVGGHAGASLYYSGFLQAACLCTYNERELRMFVM